MKNEKQATQLANIAKTIYARHVDFINSLKSEASALERDDFVWHYLLQGFATMGNSNGWRGLIGNKGNYDQVTFSALEELSASKRRNQIKSVFQSAGIRFPNRKADWLDSNFDFVSSMGGLKAVKQKLLAQPGRDKKITFLSQFKGVSKAYARNLMMDVHHPEFRDSIKIDVRIAAISKALGLAFNDYSEHEAFFLDVARKADLEGWELDRLLYNFKDEFISEIETHAIG